MVSAEEIIEDPKEEKAEVYEETCTTENLADESTISSGESMYIF